MISFTVRGGGRTPLALRHVWFAESPRKRDALLPCIFFHARALGGRAGFERRARWTSLVRIDRDEAELLDSFSRNTRYKINRAARENSDLSVAYSRPQQARQSAGAGAGLGYEDQLVSSVVTLRDQRQIVHQYIVDHQLKRVHLYKSQSGYQQIQDKELRDEIARVNRWQHYKDMLYFRNQGIQNYDFGGFARAEPGTKLANIDNLKQGFRGDLVEESIFISWSVIGWNAVMYRRATLV